MNTPPNVLLDARIDLLDLMEEESKQESERPALRGGVG